MPDDVERMLADLAPIGRLQVAAPASASGGYVRTPWAGAGRELTAWFGAQAAARGLRRETDTFGNELAWWDAGSGPAVLTGSHLDSVVEGGAYDGALGVVAALAAVDLLRERGVAPARPLGVVALAATEGSRFAEPCLGSRLAVGALPWAQARALRDAGGTALADLVEGGPPAAWAAGVAAYVELHVEAGRGLASGGTAVGVASGTGAHGRYRLDVTGAADHAGAPLAGRRDPTLTYAMTALAAHKQARLAGQRATFGRVEVAPGGAATVPARVTAWLDARAETETSLVDLVSAVERQAVARAERDGTALVLTPEQVAAPVAFDRGLTAGLGLPELTTYADHDARVLAAAGIPSAVLLVRNAAGVSHAPAEHVDVADGLAGTTVLADVLERLLTSP